MGSSTPQSSVLALVGCPLCKREMVLFGIESEADKRELYTFECEDCSHLEVRGVRLK
jgi:uncharacterized protein YbaR (Trm112 family)